MSRTMSPRCAVPPRQHNALDPAMFHGIQARRRGRRHAGARAVVLHGEGSSFCAGVDIGAHERPAVRRVIWWRARPTRSEPFPARRHRLDRQLRVPVIAADDEERLRRRLRSPGRGHPDRRTRREAHRHGGRWGLVPDMAIMQTLPRIIGRTSPRRSPTRAGASAARRPPRWGPSTRRRRGSLAEARELAADIAGRSPTRSARQAPAERGLAADGARRCCSRGAPGRAAGAERDRRGHRRHDEAARRVHRSRLSGGPARPWSRRGDVPRASPWVLDSTPARSVKISDDERVPVLRPAATPGGRHAAAARTDDPLPRPDARRPDALLARQPRRRRLAVAEFRDQFTARSSRKRASCSGRTPCASSSPAVSRTIRSRRRRPNS